MKIRNLMIAAASLFATSSMAADLPVKATPASTFFSSTYPYMSSGMFFGVYTGGTVGSVTASVPGIPANSLTTSTAAFGGTLGYAWGSKTSTVSYTLEQDIGVTNFNGNNQGLSVQGPLELETRVTVFTPFSNLQSLLPNFPNLFGTVPPFSPVAPGVTQCCLQVGFAGGVKFKDISSAYLGVASNKIWRIEPVIRAVAMEQLSNGTALYAYAEAAFPTDGKVVGPVPGSTTALGNEYTAGVGVRW